MICEEYTPDRPLIISQETACRVKHERPDLFGELIQLCQEKIIIIY